MSEKERFKDPKYVSTEKPPTGKLYETAKETYIERQLRLAKEAKNSAKNALKEAAKEGTDLAKEIFQEDKQKKCRN